MDDLYEDDQLRGARHQEIERMVADADMERRVLAFPETIEYPSPESEFLQEVEAAQIALARARQIANRCRSIDPGDTGWYSRAFYVSAAEYSVGQAMAAQDV